MKSQNPVNTTTQTIIVKDLRTRKDPRGGTNNTINNSRSNIKDNLVAGPTSPTTFVSTAPIF